MAQRPTSWNPSSGAVASGVAVESSPSAGTPSDITHGAVCDAGLVKGLKIHDPNTVAASVVDDGSGCLITTQIASHDVEFSDPNFWTKDLYFFHPEAIMGDCEASLTFSTGGDGSNPLNGTTQVALFMGFGDTLNETRALVIRFGDWSAGASKFSHYAMLGTSVNGIVDGPTRNPNGKWHMKITCVDKRVVLSWSEDGSAWTDLRDNKMDGRGASFLVGFGVYSPVADTVEIFKFTVTASNSYSP
jgi:hypothetical protein